MGFGLESPMNSSFQVLVTMQNLNILTVGAKDGKGGFFPEGISGRINTPEGFDAVAKGTEDFDGQTQVIQVCLKSSLTYEGCVAHRNGIL